MKKKHIHLLTGLILFLAVLITGFIYLPQEYKITDPWEIMYIIMRLFVFERDVAAFPKLLQLKIIYFAAPLMTISAIGTFLSYLFTTSSSLKVNFIKNHVIICGLGRTGKLIAKSFSGKGISILAIDQDNSDEIKEWCKINRVIFINGNFHNPDVFKKAKISRAQRIIFSSGDDLINIEGAFTAYDFLREMDYKLKSIKVHISDETLSENLSFALDDNSSLHFSFFDTYRIAAEEVIYNHVSKELLKGIKEINIVGFGKFGNDILSVLASDTSSKIKINVIDKKDRKNEIQRVAKTFDKKRKINFIQCDIRDMDLSDKSLYFLCTDDDIGNLSIAMAIKKNFNKGFIFIRMAHWPLEAVQGHFSNNKNMVFININHLIDKGLTRILHS